MGHCVVSEIRVGTQGWNYEDWVGPFYPRGAKAADFFDLYARVFDTVEIDSTLLCDSVRGFDHLLAQARSTGICLCTEAAAGDNASSAAV